MHQWVGFVAQKLQNLSNVQQVNNSQTKRLADPAATLTRIQNLSNLDTEDLGQSMAKMNEGTRQARALSESPSEVSTEVAEPVDIEAVISVIRESKRSVAKYFPNSLGSFQRNRLSLYRSGSAQSEAACHAMESPVLGCASLAGSIIIQ